VQGFLTRETNPLANAFNPIPQMVQRTQQLQQPRALNALGRAAGGSVNQHTGNGL